MALQSETGISDARALLLAFARDARRAVWCLELIASAQLKKGESLPDW